MSVFLFAILYLGALVCLAAAALWVFDRIRSWRHRQTPEERATERAAYRQRLGAPQWPEVERLTQGRVTASLRRLYSDRDLVQRTDFWILDPSRPGDPAGQWHINFFQPADAQSLTDEWNQLLPKGSFPFAADYMDDRLFVVLDSDGRERPVMHWYHDGGGHRRGSAVFGHVLGMAES